MTHGRARTSGEWTSDMQGLGRSLSTGLPGTAPRVPRQAGRQGGLVKQAAAAWKEAAQAGVISGGVSTGHK